VFTREKILDALWGDEKDVVDRTVDVHIKHLREKLGTAGARIKNIRGVGYKIEP
jgi:two-component system phosphate regulon response regulator PhoB/two-component system alkaline phosphatase synthesis response regulator PhoP